MKNINNKFTNVCKYKGTPKLNTNKQVNEKKENNKSTKQKNNDKYAWKKVPLKQGKEETKTTNKKITTGASGITYRYNITQKERELMDA